MIRPRAELNVEIDNNEQAAHLYMYNSHSLGKIHWNTSFPVPVLSITSDRLQTVQVVMVLAHQRVHAYVSTDNVNTC